MKNIYSYFKFCMLLVAAMMLVACGGGGGSAGSSTGSTTTTTVAAPSPTMVVAIYNASGIKVSTIDAVGNYTVRSTVRDSSGALVTDKKVTFSVSDATLATLSTTSALTNSSGYAEITVLPVSGTVSGALTISGTAVVGASSTASGSVDIAVRSTGATVSTGINVEVFNASGVKVSSIDAAGSFVSRATVRDASGQPVSGKKVTFSLSDLTLATLSATSALTNSSGVAEVPIAPASISARGAVTVSSSAVIGTSTTVTGSYDLGVVASSSPVNPKVPTLSIGIYNSSSAKVTSIDAAGNYVVRALVTDGQGIPVSGRKVTFSLSDATLAAVLTTTALTDSTGNAEVPIAPVSASVRGAVTVTANSTVGTATAVSGSYDFAIVATGTSSSTLSVAVFSSTGTKVTAINLTGAYVARATIRDALGVAVAGRKVTFSLPSTTVATLSDVSALTNSSGIAEVGISPSSVIARGAVTLSATAIVDSGTSISASYDLAVANSNVSLSALTITNTNLASAGNTSVSVTALVNGAATGGSAVNVTFAASCGRINGTAGNFSVPTNGSGIALFDYSSVATDGSLCSGVVTLTASTAGASPSSATVTVASPSANAVTFVSATPTQIFVAGSGASEQSVLKFKVLSNGAPLSGVPVTFSLQVNPGGVGLNGSGSTANVSSTTDASGLVSVTVFSGSIPGPLKVRAAITASPTVFSESQNLSVSSGPPSQRFMSLSVSTFNIEGWSIDGTSTTLTVRLADRQGNPVEDGTVVNFTAEGGQVASSCATAKLNGVSSCSVNFISQNPRPPGGRASVLAFTNGTKDYVDNNLNNRYDVPVDPENLQPGEDQLIRIGDAYRDDNENNVFDLGEFVIPRGGSLTSGCTPTGEPFPSRAATCDISLQTTVRQQAVILFSSSTPVLQVVSTSRTEVDFLLGSATNNLLPMPLGTTITADVAASAGSTCSVSKVLGSPVGNIPPTTNPSANLRTSAAVILKDCLAGDAVSISVKAPSGLETSFTSITLP